MRKALDRGLVVACGAAASVACGVLVFVVGAIVVRGFPALSLDFLARATRDAGASGGIVYQLIGTLILAATAAALCAPLATGLALAHGVFLRSETTRRRLELGLYALNGLPSILIGLLGLIVFVKFLGWGKSWLAGGALLALVMLPTATVAMIERIRALPSSYLEAGYALGLNESQVARHVVLRQSRGALATGLLLGLARATGETAPILFTAVVFSGATLPAGIVESPVLALSYHVFVLAQDAYEPAISTNAWGAAAVLLVLVFALSAAALPFRLAAPEEARDG